MSHMFCGNQKYLYEELLKYGLIEELSISLDLLLSNLLPEKIDIIKKEMEIPPECSCVNSLPDISNWNTGNAKDMSALFSLNTSIKYLPDISKWDMRNVVNINFMFFGCSNLRTLPNISKWNINNVKYMTGLFAFCPLLKELPDISKWETNNIINMSSLF